MAQRYKIFLHEDLFKVTAPALVLGTSPISAGTFGHSDPAQTINICTLAGISAGTPPYVATSVVTPPSAGSVTLNGDCTVNYNPTDCSPATSDSFVVRVTDSAGQIADVTVNVALVAPSGPTASDSDVGNVSAGSTKVVDLSTLVVGGNAPYSFALGTFNAVAVAPALSGAGNKDLNILGMALATDTEIGFTVTDACGMVSATKKVKIDVIAATPLAIATPALAKTYSHSAAIQTINVCTDATVTGGTAPYTIAITTAPTVGAASVNGSCSIDYDPLKCSTAVSDSFAVRITDAAAAFVDATVTITLNPYIALAGANGFDTITAGVADTLGLSGSVSNGTAPLVYAITSLSPGLTQNSFNIASGVLNYTGAAAGAETIGFSVTDDCGTVVNHTVAVTVNPAGVLTATDFTPAAGPFNHNGPPQTINVCTIAGVSGGTAPYTILSITPGSIGTTSAVTGCSFGYTLAPCNAAASDTVQVTVQDAALATIVIDVGITLVPPTPVAITYGAVLPTVNDGQTINEQITYSGPAGATWSIVASSGDITGVSITAGGIVTYTGNSVPNSVGTITVKVADASCPTNSATLLMAMTVVGAGAPLTIGTPVILDTIPHDNGARNMNACAAIWGNVYGGTGPYTASITTPPSVGVAVATGGCGVAYTPLACSPLLSDSYVVTITDALAATGTITYNMILTPPVNDITDNPSFYPDDTVGAVQSFAFSAIAGVTSSNSPITYALGAKSTNITINAFNAGTSLVNYTANTAGAAFINYTATDGCGYTFSGTVSWNVTATPFVINSPIVTTGAIPHNNANQVWTDFCIFGVADVNGGVGPYKATVETPAAVGTVTTTGTDCSVTYNPLNCSTATADSYQIRITDSDTPASSGVVTVNVTLTPPALPTFSGFGYAIHSVDVKEDGSDQEDFDMLPYMITGGIGAITYSIIANDPEIVVTQPLGNTSTIIRIKGNNAGPKLFANVTMQAVDSCAGSNTFGGSFRVTSVSPVFIANVPNPTTIIQHDGGASVAVNICTLGDLQGGLAPYSIQSVDAGPTVGTIASGGAGSCSIGYDPVECSPATSDQITFTVKDSTSPTPQTDTVVLNITLVPPQTMVGTSGNGGLGFPLAQNTDYTAGIGSFVSFTNPPVTTTINSFSAGIASAILQSPNAIYTNGAVLKIRTASCATGAQTVSLTTTDSCGQIVSYQLQVNMGALPAGPNIDPVAAITMAENSSGSVALTATPGGIAPLVWTVISVADDLGAASFIGNVLSYTAIPFDLGVGTAVVRATDACGRTSNETINFIMTFGCVNTAATADAGSTNFCSAVGTPATISGNVLSNDSGTNKLVVKLNGSAANMNTPGIPASAGNAGGTLQMASTGGWTYTPPTTVPVGGPTWTDTFTYNMNGDCGGEKGPINLVITVTNNGLCASPLPSCPTSVTVAQDIPISIAVSALNLGVGGAFTLVTPANLYSKFDVRATWPAVAGATGYKILWYKDTVLQGGMVNIGNVFTDTRFGMVTGAGQQIRAQVVAYNAAGDCVGGTLSNNLVVSWPTASLAVTDPSGFGANRRVDITPSIGGSATNMATGGEFNATGTPCATGPYAMEPGPGVSATQTPGTVWLASTASRIAKTYNCGSMIDSDLESYGAVVIGWDAATGVADWAEVAGFASFWSP